MKKRLNLHFKLQCTVIRHRYEPNDFMEVFVRVPSPLLNGSKEFLTWTLGSISTSNNLNNLVR